MTNSDITLPTILDMAYLSARIYEDQDDNDFFETRMKKIHTSWRNVPSMIHREFDNNYGGGMLIGAAERIINIESEGVLNTTIFKEPDIGLQMGVYINHNLKCSVLAIRGTHGWMNLLEDGMYTLNFIPELYARAIKYFRIFTSKTSFLKEYPLVACTGHSLGGIIAKMIAPMTCLSTYAFNSPGVLQILNKNKLKLAKILNTKELSSFMKLHGAKEVLHKISDKKSTSSQQEVITYITNQDVIGNLRRDYDFGEHILIQVGHEPAMPNSQVRIKNTNPNVELTKTDLNLLMNNLPTESLGGAENTALISLYYLIEHAVNPDLFQRITTFMPGNKSKGMMEYHSIKKVVLKTLLDKYPVINARKIKLSKKYD